MWERSGRRWENFCNCSMTLIFVYKLFRNWRQWTLSVKSLNCQLLLLQSFFLNSSLIIGLSTIIIIEDQVEFPTYQVTYQLLWHILNTILYLTLPYIFFLKPVKLSKSRNKQQNRPQILHLKLVHVEYIIVQLKRWVTVETAKAFVSCTFPDNKCF